MPSLLMSALVIGAPVAVITYVLWTATYNIFFHPLASIPGPKLYAASQIPYLYRVVQGKWPFVLLELHEKYGPVVRIAPTDVMFITPAALEKIYGHKTLGQPSFPKDHGIYAPRVTDASNVLVANDADHSRMRRLLSHAFSERALRGQQDIAIHYIDTLVFKLKDLALHGQTVHLNEWYTFSTFDLIGDLTFGQSFGCLENSQYHPWVKNIFDSIVLTAYMQVLIRMPQLMPLVNILIPKKRVEGHQKHTLACFETAKKRVESGNVNREDFMSYILRHQDEKGMTMNEIGENAIIFILAGSETTASLLSGATFYLLKNPAAYQRLVDEVRSEFQSEEEITMLRVGQLSYLAAVINESLRFYPPVPWHLPRRVPKGGTTLEGYWLPEDTIVAFPHWSAYHSSGNFSRPDEFIPERWLNDARFAHDAKEVVQPFSIGPRNCLGKNLANVESRLILARVFWNFDIELQPESQQWDDQKVYLTWDKPPLRVKLTVVKREEKTSA